MNAINNSKKNEYFKTNNYAYGRTHQETQLQIVLSFPYKCIFKFYCAKFCCVLVSSIIKFNAFLQNIKYII